MAVRAHIWLLDDDAELCQLLGQLLGHCGWSLRCFGEPRELEAALTEQVPDLLLLDQMLPHKPGTQVLAGLRRAGYRMPVLMLSALGAPTDRVHGLEVGADDYLAKPFLLRELQLRIAVLLRMAGSDRNPLASEGTYLLGSLRFHPAEQRVCSAAGTELRLSRGEVAILLAFCRAPGLVLSRDQLAQSCGSLVDPASSRSFDVRLSKLRRRLEELHGSAPDNPSAPESPSAPAGASAGLFETVRGRGYRLAVPLQALPA